MDEGESRNLNKETFVPKITEITVSAGRTFNHPHESFSNLKPHVALKVEVLPGEDAGEVAKALQAQAEGLVEDLKECAGNNFPVFPKYVIKPSARSQTGRRAAWTPMHRKSNGR